MLQNALLISFDPPAVECADLYVKEGQVADKGPSLSIPGGTEVVNLEGRILMPGLVDAHARLGQHPFQAIPRPPSSPTSSPASVAGEEAVIWTAFAAGVDALQSGTTCLLDLHSSPRFAPESLKRLRDVILTLGLRCLLSYRVSQEDGPEHLDEILEASRRAAAYGGDEAARMGLGVAASGNLAAETLAALSQIHERYGSPVHIDLAQEGAARPRPAEEISRELAALEAAGLLGDTTLVAGGHSLDAATREHLGDLGVTLVLALEKASTAEHGFSMGAGDALGSGFGPANMFAALRRAWFQIQGGDAPPDPDLLLQLLSSGHRLASRIFGVSLGSFEPGAVADFLVFNYLPAIPLNQTTLAHHLLFGLDPRHLESVLVQGRFLLRDRRITHLSVAELFRQTQRGALDLWDAWTNTPFPGWAAPRKRRPAAGRRAARGQKPPAEPQMATTKAPKPPSPTPEFVADELEFERDAAIPTQVSFSPEDPSDDNQDGTPAAKTEEAQVPGGQGARPESEDPFGAGLF